MTKGSIQAALTTFQKNGLKAIERTAAMKPESVTSTKLNPRAMAVTSTWGERSS